MFLLKKGSVGPGDQQINLVSPKSQSEKVPRLFRRLGRLSTKSLPFPTSYSLSTMFLCECKIASALKRFCVILDRSQVLTRLAKEKDFLGVALVAPVVSNIFMMVITLLMMTRS